MTRGRGLLAILIVFMSQIEMKKLEPKINKSPKDKILLGPPYITSSDEKAVVKVLRSGQLSLGPKTEEFEKKFAKWMGCKYAVAVSSGTTGLHLCVRAAEIKEGDEVITSPFSFVSSVNCILYEKAKPVFADIDPKTFNIDVNKIEKAITKKTKAILPVHIFGYPAEMDKINSIAKKYNLAVIEDAAEALGAKYKNKKIGSLGNLSVFAFYPNKQMTTAEGGMITTNDKKQYLLLKSLLNQGRKLGSDWLEHNYLGYNYRITEISAALGISQLRKADLFLENRNKTASLYNHYFKKNHFVKTILKNDNNHLRSWFVYVVQLEKTINRKKLMKELAKKRIPSRAYLPSIHLQPYLKKMFGYKKGDFPVCEEVSKRTLALPFYTGMNEKDIKYVCKNLIEVIKLLR